MPQTIDEILRDADMCVKLAACGDVDSFAKASELIKRARAQLTEGDKSPPILRTHTVLSAVALEPLSERVHMVARDNVGPWEFPHLVICFLDIKSLYAAYKFIDDNSRSKEMPSTLNKYVIAGKSIPNGGCDVYWNNDQKFWSDKVGDATQFGKQQQADEALPGVVVAQPGKEPEVKDVVVKPLQVQNG